MITTPVSERARNVRFLGMHGAVLFPRYLCHACQVCVREWSEWSRGDGGRDNNDDDDEDGGVMHSKDRTSGATRRRKRAVYGSAARDFFRMLRTVLRSSPWRIRGST